ncbi:hypothetical protein JX265_005986 [Neoarthrinium moseri]|uniref:DUF155 domain-containing protein n=1 Tax=Neoarthrinium moseri TaxID=1658444 RepID=A0A9Q0APH5_9PEZI|nr:uncharacterized protein JN550_004200 [Neoarthrinium moseri]KAI1855583.1 hypothetical protein JX266_000448 [Neoarthrinium moseri]KAI1870946.1 hypothetical protein JX265_005986 [Neoarthrinium moseri]KAI1871997.1 hypothetical protein JN550_004200 [Neoarthrinium moseri]
MASSKRGPSVLVTDSRQRPPSRGVPQRPGTAGGGPSRMPSMRFMTVDNVLQYASEIPSGQPRLPPGQSLRGAAGTRRVSGGGLPNLASRTGQHIMPSRTTKISEKLVLLPETDEKAGGSDEETEEPPKDDGGPPNDEEMDILKKRGGLRGKSYAERLPKGQRTEKVSRVTAYCTAQSYKMKSTSEFLRKKHDAKTKLYDDCLYSVYHIPILPGVDGYRVRSRPILKTPGTGKTILDLEIERNERRDDHMGYDYHHYDVHGEENGSHRRGSDDRGRDMNRSQQNEPHSPSPVNRLAPDAKNFAEMFVYSYGVVVFWNFTETQEKNILADLAFAENESGVSLVTRPLDQSDFETEEFHFEYSADIKRPRVFNDMITLLPRSDHMVKLTISHAIAQSTKLCFFEERMSETMLDAQHVPKRLALTGELNMTRTEIVKILGRLFKSRVDINLSSNILDVPNFFWDAEPTLHPLYAAIREYLDIDLRTKVLNERCQVFLDLAEILSDSVADAKMSAITWIVIVLIIVSILVTVTEVVLRFTILSKEKGKNENNNSAHAAEILRSRLHGAISNATLEELRLWSAGLSEQERQAVCGADYVGTTFAGI